ncbi:putative ribosome-binding factor A, mitochondrial isoform X2 [Protopterus annectens]|uniref:putative ribosome-binding factor A, mitochondrial isoform X2 n=1 Tax=Protopterus annectens TaxID=7888 RepID=UPI001CFBD46E|nr:putative ribosome-binding factor A, mitochondrial isoform X2 [Protopterus annectens]
MAVSIIRLAKHWRCPLSGSCQYKQLHSTITLHGKRNLLKMFATKAKKKYWYESPTLGSNLMWKTSSLEIQKAVPTKLRREDSIRMRILNTILYKEITDLMMTPEVSQELFDLKMELSKVSLPVDFSACRVYWKTCGSVEQDQYACEVLQRSAPRIRYLLQSRQVLGSVPPIVFVKDKEYAAALEVERLLKIADFGPDEEVDISEKTDASVSKVTSSFNKSSMEVCNLSEVPSSVSSGLFGIDHQALNKQITEYKKRNQENIIDTSTNNLSQKQQEQLAEIRKKKKVKKKKKLYDDDVSPKEYLLEKYSEDSFTSDGAEDQDNEMEQNEEEEISHTEADFDSDPVHQPSKPDKNVATEV